jgi:hypothetical protein
MRGPGTVTLTSTPWVCLRPGSEYQLLTHHGFEPWTLRRQDEDPAGWYLDGQGFDHFGLGDVTVSLAHWQAFGMVVVYLTTVDADPLRIVNLTPGHPPNPPAEVD